MTHCSVACSHAAHRAWRKRGRAKATAIIDAIKLERGCLHCGYRVSAKALDFHHRDPAAKLFDVQRKVGGGVSPRVLAEIAKCDVLCSNCHRVLHHG